MTELHLDIVSDVVCPWCIVGYRQLAIALQQTETSAQIHWHPFELNPDMPDAGQNLLDHMGEKYGLTLPQCQENRQKLIDIGKSLGFEFNYDESSRMVNTFKAHQLLHWAGLNGKEHDLKLALFESYFTDRADINDPLVLFGTIESLGMDSAIASDVLEQGNYVAAVREREQLWISRGVRGVPAIVINSKYMFTGAQGVENYTKIIEQIRNVN